jgi:DNA-binding NarL/FixJ family response regulator
MIVELKANAPVNVLLVDDHAIVREGLRALLDDEEGMRIVGEAANGDEAVDLAGKLQPDLILMDLKMPGLSAPDAIRVIRARHPGIQILVLTSYAEDRQMQEVMSAGALGYVLKDVAKSELLRAMSTVARGQPWLHAQAQRSLLNRMRKPAEVDPFHLLTDRERSVLKLIAQGMSNRDIGRALHLTEGTVKGYVSNVLSKLRLEDRTQAALLAVKHGMDGDRD